MILSRIWTVSWLNAFLATEILWADSENKTKLDLNVLINKLSNRFKFAENFVLNVLYISFHLQEKANFARWKYYVQLHFYCLTWHADVWNTIGTLYLKRNAQIAFYFERQVDGACLAKQPK
jgi:hypothetical protein